MNEFFKDALGIVRPLLELAITIAVPVLALRLNTLIGSKSEQSQTEIEKLLRDAIHASASNALTFALQKKGLSVSELNVPLGANSVRDQAIRTAMEYVKEKNPDALKKLGVSDSNLKDIITAKLPTIPPAQSR